MSTAEDYNGHSNRETWACCLWLSNDYGLYQEVIEARDKLANRFDGRELIHFLADWIKDYVEYDLKEFSEQSEKDSTIRQMFAEIGSLWRIDWEEIAEGFIDC